MKVALSPLAAILFAIGLIGLFPESAAQLAAAGMTNMSVGFSADAKGWHVLGAVGGAAMVASAWTLAPIVRRSP
ncbi:MAG TPA: hypothetical protein VG889_17060 [Rhizomicrobium sp.]|nr:hypothetical protein [Rhizomicrobium sp.]